MWRNLECELCHFQFPGIFLEILMCFLENLLGIDVFRNEKEEIPLLEYEKIEEKNDGFMVLEYIGKNNIRMMHLLDFSKKKSILIVF